jgi:hypothetical protein
VAHRLSPRLSTERSRVRDPKRHSSGLLRLANCLLMPRSTTCTVAGFVHLHLRCVLRNSARNNWLYKSETEHLCLRVKNWTHQPSRFLTMSAVRTALVAVPIPVGGVDSPGGRTYSILFLPIPSDSLLFKNKKKSNKAMEITVAQFLDSCQSAVEPVCSRHKQVIEICVFRPHTCSAPVHPPPAWSSYDDR